MKGWLKRILQFPVACVLFFVAGLLSALLLVWMAVVSVGLLVRKVVLVGLEMVRGRKETGGDG